jgi:hypothetical protein
MTLRPGPPSLPSGWRVPAQAMEETDPMTRLTIALVATLLCLGTAQAQQRTCNAEAHDQCKQRGGEWNSSSCTCSR